MKALLTAALVAVALPAQAADMKAPQAQAAASCGWCGVYAGVTVGYGWSELKASAFEEDAKFDPKQVIPGGVVGYRWQNRALVFGAELNGAWHGHGDTIFGGEATAKVKYTGDVTAQIGLALSNGFLVYVLAGPAFANAQVNVEGLVSSANHFGWVVGGGADFKLFSDNVVVGIQYKHAEYGDSSYFGVINASAKSDTVTGRLIYRFSH